MRISIPIVLLFLLFMLGGYSSGAVSANFTADYTAGCPPLVVHFTNTSTGATSYTWDLGNGSPPIPLTDASGSYLATGTYTVTLTAYNGASTSTKRMVITVYPLPTVDFYVPDTSVCPGAPITFTSTSTGGTPGPMTYVWNFGDGHNSTATSPVYSYPTPGFYNITLAVTNSQGCSKSLTKAGYIHIFDQPVPNFTASPSHFCRPPAIVNFVNLTTGTSPFTFRWTFGDGGSSSTTTPTHTYSSTGSYNVKLAVTDGNGCKDSVTVPGFVSINNLSANFTSATTACLYATIAFSNTSSTHLSSLWDFGDSRTSVLENPLHIYYTPGTYTVRLIVFDGSCYDTITHTVTILPGPVATFTITPTNPCPAPATLSFNATVPTGSTTTWLYGDGFTGSGTSTVHTYTYNGVDTVKLIVTGTSGCRDTIIQIYNLYNLFVDINHDTVATGCVPLTVQFTCHTWTTVPDSIIYHPYPFGIASYVWTYGDGSPPVTGGSVISHTYMAVGIYYAKVVVTTTNGCRDSATLEVMVGTPPVAGFTATPTEVCVHRGVQFTNTSTGADGYRWYFGDGTTSVEVNPNDTFNVPGTYTVTLIAYFHGCPDTFIRPNYITIDSPLARIISNYMCVPPTSVTFIDTSWGDDTHMWYFGDGASSSAHSVLHNYPSLAIYNVMLTTYNARSGCRDTAYKQINLIRPIPEFTASDTAVCRDDIVSFTPHIIGDTAVDYFWYRNYINRDFDTGAVYQDTFYTTGRYTISLVIKDSHGCKDTMTKVNYVLVARPVDSFTTLPSSGCLPLTVTFHDYSRDVPGTTFTSFLWSYGDGGSGTVSTATSTHTYTAVGVYDVIEVVTDNVGCSDTLHRPSLISVYHPRASFYATSTYPCVGVNDNFINVSTGIISSLWLFGDGDTSTSYSGVHAYALPGVYTVKLVVTDAHGCTDTATYVGYINVTKPAASFYMDDSFTICLPLLTNFFNTSTGAVSYAWNFGDGNTSVAFNPSDIYIVSGYFPVTLVASNIYGCTDTAIRHVNVYGYAGAFTYAPLQGCAPLTVDFHASIMNVPSIVWDFQDGTTSLAGTVDSAKHTYTIPGAYVPRLILSDNTGCQNSSVGLDTIKIDAITSKVKTNPNPVCVNTTISFSDSATSYWSTITSYLWWFTGLDSSSLDSPTWLYDTAGTYQISVTVKDGWGCTLVDTENITVYPLPVIKASPDTVVCVGDPATLKAKGGNTYTWSPPYALSCTACNPTSARPSVVTTYTVTGKDIHGCINYDTVSVYLRTKTESGSWGDTEICFGEVVPLFDTGGSKYTWYPATGLNATNIANPLATPNYSINYMVVSQLANCIPDTNYVQVIVHPLPIVDAGPDQTLLAGSIAQLGASGSNISSFDWGGVSTLSCDSCFNPVASMSVTTTYVVKVKSSFGCPAEDSVTIHLFCNSSQVFVPNSFTPNGDGENDVFYPRGKGISIIKSFRIYNRWGELLFEKSGFNLNDATYGWNGMYQNDTPKPDVYVYVIDAICETGDPVFLKGDVTIIR